MKSPEEIQQAIEQWYRNKDEIIHTYERASMYLTRHKAALDRWDEQGFIGCCAQLINAILFCGPWPWAELQMWGKHVGRTIRHARKLEKEQIAIEKEYHLVVTRRESENQP